MVELPNGLTIFNATAGDIVFWNEEWDVPVIVPEDYAIEVEEKWQVVESFSYNKYRESLVEFSIVPSTYKDEWGTPLPISGWEIIKDAKDAGADIIVGSRLAARAYPGEVHATVSVKGKEHYAKPNHFLRF